MVPLHMELLLFCAVITACCLPYACVCSITSRSHQAALSTEPIPTIGLRRPLGVDHRRRRYWVLGGASGAWRVYCEEGDGSNWVRPHHMERFCCSARLQAFTPPQQTLHTNQREKLSQTYRDCVVWTG